MIFAARVLLATLASFGLAAGAGAAARDEPSAGTVNLRIEGVGEPIVVVGDLDLEKDRVRDAVRDIAMRGRSFDEPLMRYQDPLCITVLGFGEVLGERVAERIRMQARVVGAEVAEPGCMPNATVAMVGRPAVLIERMRQERPKLLSAESLHRIRATLSAGYPAVSWASTQRRDQFGRSIASGNPLSGLEFPGPLNELLITRDNRFASRIKVPFTIARAGAVVIFDAYKLDNVHLDQLADYAVMRILGNPRPRPSLGADQPDTILNLFRMDPLEASPGLTLMDVAYLRGLYALRPNEPATRLESSTIAAYRDLAALGCEETNTCEADRDPG